MAVTLNLNRLNPLIKRYRQNLTVYLKIYKDSKGWKKTYQPNGEQKQINKKQELQFSQLIK